MDTEDEVPPETAAESEERTAGEDAADEMPPSVWSLRGAALWLVLAGMLFVVLCLLENLKQAMLWGG